MRVLDLCIPWWGRMHTAGYGVLSLRGREVYAHRMVYEECFGLIPAGLQIDHLCRNRACVNPAHLEPVTHLENQRRGAAAKRSCKYGHDWSDPKNVYVRNNGRRWCAACARERWS